MSRAFGIDVRALSLYRIGLGIVLLADLAMRGGDLVAHYTNFGVLPLEAWAQRYGTPDGSGRHLWWSLHLLSGGLLWQILLFVIAAQAAVAVLVGYRTRLAVILSWLLLISLQNRNPAILDGGDTVLRVTLFWAMFLPLGEVWSLDARRRGRPGGEAPRLVLSVAGVAFLLQVAIVYWASVVHKWHPRWVSEGSAIYYALNLDIFVTPFGERLLDFPELLRHMTIGVFWFECFGPLLAFMPWRHNLWRTLAILSFWGFHLGLSLTLELGLFPWICMVSWIVFLPSGTLDRVVSVCRRLVAGSQSFAPETMASVGRDAPASGLVADGADGTLSGVRRRLALGGNGLLAALLVYMIAWNVRDFEHSWCKRVLPREWNWVGRITRLDQHWRLFAPFPSTDDGWYVIVGEFADTRTINPFDPLLPLTFDKPSRISTVVYKNQRWRKYLANLRRQNHSDMHPWFAQYLQRKWNRGVRHHPELSLRAVHIFFQREWTPPPGEPLPPPQTLLLHAESFDGRPVSRLGANEQGMLVVVVDEDGQPVASEVSTSTREAAADGVPQDLPHALPPG